MQQVELIVYVSARGIRTVAANVGKISQASEAGRLSAALAPALGFLDKAAREFGDQEATHLPPSAPSPDR